MEHKQRPIDHDGEIRSGNGLEALVDMACKKEKERYKVATRAKRFNPNNTWGAKNFGQWMYAKKSSADYSIKMARSVRAAMQNWRGTHIAENIE